MAGDAVNVQTGAEDTPAADDDLFVPGVADHGSGDGHGIDGPHEGIGSAEVARVLVNVKQHRKGARELIGPTAGGDGDVAEHGGGCLGIGGAPAAQEPVEDVAGGWRERPGGLIAERGGVQAGIQHPDGPGVLAGDLDQDGDSLAIRVVQPPVPKAARLQPVLDRREDWLVVVDSGA